jgi:hypothetical protein
MSSNAEQTLELAATLYTTYCMAVGGKAFNGHPLPDWERFAADPAKATQSAAWVRVAEVAQYLVDETERRIEDSHEVGRALTRLEHPDR